jgi:7-keto-8-aminopelargonate synthetase-like enzyme
MACAATSIRKLMHSHNKRQHLWENTRQLHGGLTEAGFTLATKTPESAIIAVLMPDQEATARMWSALIELGVYVNMARPPATPAGIYLLRCSICAEHTREQIATIIERFRKAAEITGLKLGA